jgi:hypothetical protein
MLCNSVCVLACGEQGSDDEVERRKGKGEWGLGNGESGGGERGADDNNEKRLPVIAPSATLICSSIFTKVIRVSIFTGTSRLSARLAISIYYPCIR